MRSIQIVLLLVPTHPPIAAPQWYLETPFLGLTAKWPAGLPGHQVGANTGCWFCSQETKFTITAQSVGREVGEPPSFLAIKCLPQGTIVSQMGVKELGPSTRVLPGPLNERTSPGRGQEGRFRFKEMLRPTGSACLRPVPSGRGRQHPRAPRLQTWK